MCRSAVVLVLTAVIAAAYGYSGDCTPVYSGTASPYPVLLSVQTYPNVCDSEFQGYNVCGEYGVQGLQANICDPYSSAPAVIPSLVPPLLTVDRIPVPQTNPPCTGSAVGSLTVYCTGPAQAPY